VAAATLLALCLGLTACGGGSSSSTTAAAAKSEPTQNQPGEGAKPQLSRPAGGGKGSGAKRGKGGAAAGGEEAIPPQLKRQAGSASPFLVPTGDNSIPTYGSEASASQQAEATAVLSAYLAARAAGDWSTACAEMAATVRKQLELLAGEAGAAKQSCGETYAKLSERAPASGRADPLTHVLTSLRVESPHAFALFYGPGKQQYLMPMEEEGSAWKVTQIAPLAWPIGSETATSP
jgi:hypothetical protein